MNTKIAKRHDRNPFVENMMVPVGKRQVTLSKLGKDDNVLINQHTGEIHGTHVTTYKRVDSEQFIKLFTANVALTFDLNAAGIKAFNVLLWTMQSKTIDSDLVPLDKFTLEEFVEAHGGLSLSQATFLRGLAVLEKAQIVAKHLRQGWYYINPNFVFNGDRIAFTQVIERTKRGERDEKTLDIFGDE